MANTTVAFNLPSPYQTDLDKIAQQQKMAELLQAQSLQPTERYSYKGIEARSPVTAGLAKMLQGFTAMQMQEKGLEEQKALGERYKSESTDTLRRAFEAGSGMPERAAIQDPQEMEQMADQGTQAQPNIPAVAPNQQRMAQILMGSPNPAQQAFGMTTMQKELENQRFMNAGNAGTVVPPVSTTGSGAPVAQPTSAPAIPGFGGPAGGLPMQLWLQLPNGREDYIKQLSKENDDRNKPTDKIRELRAAGVTEGSPQWNAALTNILTAGGIYQPNAEGGVGLAKGFVTGAGDIKRAEEEAKAENEVVTRTVGGREVLGTNRQFKILATGNAPTEAEAKEVANWAFNNGLKLSIKFPQTGGMPQGSSGGGAPGQPSSVRNPTAADSTYSAERAKSFSTMADKIGASWEIATKMNGMLDQLDLLYQDPNVTSGALAENISGLKGLAASLNIDIAGRGSEEAIQSITNRFALELRNPSGGAGMPGAMSDADRTFLASIPPGLSKTPAGRALIAQGMRSVNDRDRQIANMAQRYEERVGRLDNGFIKEMREWSDANPLLSPQIKSAMQEIMRRTR